MTDKTFSSIKYVEGPNRQQIIRLCVQQGERSSVAEVFLHGAHVTRWEENGKPPFLFLSKKAILDGSKAIRGGIPICFPQFSDLGSLPAHGFARNQKWEVVNPKTGSDQKESDTAEVTLSLVDSETTRKNWLHKFVCLYTVRLTGAVNSALSCQFQVSNKNSDANDEKASLSFTCALHTYFSIGDILKTTVSSNTQQGMEGLVYRDNLQARKEFKSTDAHIHFTKETDRIYLDTPDHLVVHDTANNRRLNVNKKGFRDVVIWNPWIDKAKSFADFDAREYESMVCVEAAEIAHPPKLAPGQSWIGSITLSSGPLSAI